MIFLLVIIIYLLFLSHQNQLFRQNTSLQQTLYPSQKNIDISSNIYLLDFDGWSYLTQTVILIDNLQLNLECSVDNNYPLNIFYVKKEICKILNNCDQNDLGNYLNLTKDIIFDNVYNNSTLIEIQLFVSNNIQITKFSSILAESTNYTKLLGLQGKIGLGRGIKTNQYQQNNFLETLINQKQTSQKMYSFYYGNTRKYLDSIVIIGKANENLFEFNNYSIIPTNQQSPYWEILISDIYLRGIDKQIQFENISESYALLSTISPFIELQRNIIKQIIINLNQMTGLYCFIHKDNSYLNDLELIYCMKNKLFYYQELNFPYIVFKIHDQNYYITPQTYISNCIYLSFNQTQICGTFLKVSTNIYQTILGTPFLREYYCVFNQEKLEIRIGKSRKVVMIYKYSYFWYYTLIVLVFFWAIVMITCGIYYKVQMNGVMVLVSNIYKYLLFRDANARTELLLYQFQDD